ncbi:hypothetical protein TNCV_198151 [Trichonephila clavipes]|nr:hypothetical protein TNCV_198151 [Trichonephila clavipes]
MTRQPRSDTLTTRLPWPRICIEISLRNVTIGIAFQASITAEVSACRGDGRFGWGYVICALIRLKGVLWDLDWRSEKTSPVFEQPFRQTTPVQASMLNGAVILLEEKWAFPRNIALELGVQHCLECPHTSQSSCFQSQELTDPGQTTRNTPHHYVSTTKLNSRHKMQSLKKRSPGIRQTQTRPSDCQTVKRDSSLQRTVFHRSTVQ